MNPVCAHGHLARSCALCEFEQTIAALKAENAALKARLRKANDALARLKGVVVELEDVLR